MEERSFCTAGKPISTTAIFTGIEGGGGRGGGGDDCYRTQEKDGPKVREIAPADFTENLNQSTPRRGILKTTTIEQSLAQT